MNPEYTERIQRKLDNIQVFRLERSFSGLHVSESYAILSEDGHSLADPHFFASNYHLRKIDKKYHNLIRRAVDHGFSFVEINTSLYVLSEHYHKVVEYFTSLSRPKVKKKKEKQKKKSEPKRTIFDRDARFLSLDPSVVYAYDGKDYYATGLLYALHYRNVGSGEDVRRSIISLKKKYYELDGSFYVRHGSAKKILMVLASLDKHAESIKDYPTKEGIDTPVKDHLTGHADGTLDPLVEEEPEVVEEDLIDATLDQQLEKDIDASEIPSINDFWNIYNTFFNEPEDFDFESVDLFSMLKADMSRYRLLQRDEEAVIGYFKTHGEPNIQKLARDILFYANLGFVAKKAKAYANRGLSYMDLLQEGFEGLMVAVEKYDHSRGFRFSTFAHFRLRQAFDRALKNKAKNIRVPVHMEKKHAKALALANDGRTIEEIMGELKMERYDVVCALTGQSYTKSFSDPAGEDREFGETVGVEPEFLKADEIKKRARLLEALKKITFHGYDPRKDTVYREAFALMKGLVDGKVRDRKEIGDQLGLTKENMRRLEEKALDQLRRPSLIRELEDLL